MQKKTTRRSYLRGIAAGTLGVTAGLSGCVGSFVGDGRPGAEYRQFILPQHLTQPGQEQRYHTVYRPQAFAESSVLPGVEQKLLATLPAVRGLETPMEIDLCIGGSGNFGLTASFDQAALQAEVEKRRLEVRGDYGEFVMGRLPTGMIAVGNSQIVVSKFDTPSHYVKPILEQFDESPIEDTDVFNQAASGVNANYMGIFDFDPGMFMLALQGITVTSMTHSIEPADDKVACVTKIHCDSSVEAPTQMVEPVGTAPEVTRLLRYADPEVTVNGDLIKISETMGIDQVAPLR